MVQVDVAPANAEELRAAILERYDSLSKRLRQIASYVLDEPNAIALETLAVVAERCGVQPSAIVRFAKSFGFDGATQMQRLFRDSLLSGGAAPGYGERVRQFKRSVDGRGTGDPKQVLDEFVEGNILALQNLGASANPAELAAAVKMIADAETVYVTGFRRSFPVAAYLAYSLHQAEKRTVLVDSVGGMAHQQIHGLCRRDLLIAVSYHPYAEEAVGLIEVASNKACRVLSITDSLVSPVGKPASMVLQVREAEIRKFRSLSSSMCLAQTLVIAYVFVNSQNGRRAAAAGASRSGRRKK